MHSKAAATFERKLKFSFFIAVLQKTSYGPAQVYINRDQIERAKNTRNYKPEDWKTFGDDTFEVLPSFYDSGQRTLNKLEMQFCQYMALEERRDAERVISYGHSGGQQLVTLFGPTKGHRADLLITNKGRLDFVQFHSTLHYCGHTPDCPRASRIYNEPFIIHQATKMADKFSQGYANALNARIDAFKKEHKWADEMLTLHFTFTARYECEFFHSRKYEYEGQQHGTLLKYLKAKYGDACVFASSFQPRLRARELMKKILYDEEAFGFVAILGGVEKQKDLCSKMMGMCHQKYSSKDINELGSRTLEVAASKYHGDEEKARQFLKKTCEQRKVTMSKKSFEKDTTQLLSIEYFRYLKFQRKLENYRELF